MSIDDLYDEHGRYKTNPKYREILKLDKMLTDENIPHECINYFDGWQVIYPSYAYCRIMDAIEHFGSYGKDEDKLEIMGLLTEEEKQNDTVLGYLTAEEVFTRIKEHWENQGNKG